MLRRIAAILSKFIPYIFWHLSLIPSYSYRCGCYNFQDVQIEKN